MQRFEEVDGLRAVACALVIWHHVAEAYAGIAGGSLWMHDFAQACNLGWIGILAFFAISGYVIPSSLRGGRGDGLRWFAVRRFWRLWPPFWFAVLATWLLTPDQFTAARLGWNFTMLPSLGGQLPAAGHFWTLEIELVFYVVISALFLICGRLGWAVITPVFVGMSAWYIEWSKFPLPDYWQWLLLFLTMMFWGAACREVVRFDFARWTGARWVGLTRAAVLGLATGLLALRPLKSAYFGWSEGEAGLLRFGLTTAAAIFLFLLWVVLKPVRSDWLARVGRWTYSTYLLHAVVFYGGLKLIHVFDLAVLRGWPLPVYVVLMVILGFAAGGAAFRWIEGPSDRVGHRLTGGRRE
ncbi:MAG: hypothetical protein RIS54_751 [Verrucomicrobiota bacterium]